MKTTWMVKFIAKNKLVFSEYYYYYYYLITLFNLLAYSHFKFIFYKLHWKLKYFQKNFTIKHSVFFLNNKKINKYLNNRIGFKLITRDNRKIFNNSNIKNGCYSANHSFFRTKIFYLFTLFNYSLNTDQFKYHYNFRLFYIQNISNDVAVIDVKKFLNRWNDALNLLFNIFFYDFNPLLFSSSWFKTETLALNWNYNHFDINTWKYYFPFFVFKLNNYNSKTGFFFEKLSSLNINFFIVTDCFYHYKNLFYMRKKNCYSIGLVNVNIDPWVIAYPIVSFFESLLVQLFFFKLVILIQRQALLLKFLFFKNLWSELLLYKNKNFLF